MPKSEYTPEETIDKLIGFDPTENKPEEPYFEPATPTPQQPKQTAAEALKAFLDVNGIQITVSPPSEGIKTVSDGSIILQAPKILVTYKQ